MILKLNHIPEKTAQTSLFGKYFLNIKNKTKKIHKLICCDYNNKEKKDLD